MLPSLRALVAFETVAKLGSIGAAARELHVTQAAVSQQLKSLEDYLDCALFERSQRGVVLTAVAQQYLPVVTGSLQHLRLQTEVLFGKQQPDVLRVKANHSIGHNWLIPNLNDFITKFPFIRLDLTLVDWPSREPCTDADVEITNGFIETEHTRAERLFQESWLMVCSPCFKALHAEALSKGDLSSLPAIQVKGYEESWMQWLAHNKMVPVAPNIQLELSNSLHALEAVKQGIGILLVRSLVAARDLQAGYVVEALPGSMPSESGHYLITANKRDAKVNFFCDWLHQQN
ncbi:LysR substrate-binding domain-containing protein [Pectobacteriaceae bacterium CE70]|uniref:LysR family transcriptional regulator n=1 Tax=Serratia sp. (strain ATCC 39006) TaxID=104623 RepID=A0A2I5TJA1_SERS3|nr:MULTISPECIES: LysR substrate-binding domain-containing protein [Enterobacterales]WJV56726.1 LysR substrate-binding domain-containing protein [Pectobacteriaceae bacterium C111]WJV61130.1 LysR substrate-binding domain-containing protein [Pectobacteriaceae bacterium C52]WJV65459.1 LysR substrate-binding domain-containing protein [Pectobacteriaceae bacterium CE70]WJY09478.1 LysR substrate-binding domain-containing protein [Pectobacteriaceae bacterium C80]WJY16564.1 LysR substrate-binding domain